MRSQLLTDFQNQAKFADGYSPLYSQIFGIVAGWLAAERTDPIVDWLLALAAERRSFDVTLLLPAALHRDVLAGVPEAAPLAAFYPTVGGRAPNPADTAAIGSLESALRQVILARGDALTDFIRRANVQTNETGRGLVWLWPVAMMRWPAIHLIELGASAGLNLLAERRRYRLANADTAQHTLLSLGEATAEQFTCLVRQGGAIQPALPPIASLPTVLSRVGGDLSPFYLRTAEDELTLAAFVWADQPQRLIRLREGIAALHAAEASAAPVRLYPLALPDELPAFLERHTAELSGAPIVLFNTVVTMYLPDRGASLAGHVAEWAMRQTVPVLWLQLEPLLSSEEPPPERDWHAWTANLWRQAGGRRAHSRWHVAWAHPHVTALHWSTQIDAFLSATMQS